MKSKTYEEFVQKFEPKKTTDDCYTPPEVMNVVTNYVLEKYPEIRGKKIIRPFYPDGDYESENYENAVVIDNPPFSILTKIVRFYEENKIPFFLFAPSMTLFGVNRGKENYIVTCASVIYENGANVSTSFVTNLGSDRVTIAGNLRDRIDALKPNKQKEKSKYRKNEFSAATLGKFCRYGVDFTLNDIQEINPKQYGGALLFGDNDAGTIEKMYEVYERRKV